MGKKRDKGRLTPFVPRLRETLATPAWRQLSHGARSLYVALKGNVPRDRNTAWLSFRDARLELTSSPRKIGEWFDELQHYGFIVMHTHGSLGVDGKGKAPRWRLTELGVTRVASNNDLLEPPTKDYLRWNGIIFEPKRRMNSPSYEATKKQNPVHHVGNRVCTT
jgi:hypothetical protein